jgi:hypothetical protein
MNGAQHGLFRIDDYELDTMPTDQQATALRRIYDGDRIVIDIRGATFTWERGGPKPRRYLIESLLNSQWVMPPCPDGPLFGEQRDGRLTVRGEYALLRYRDVTRT